MLSTTGLTVKSWQAIFGDDHFFLQRHLDNDHMQILLIELGAFKCFSSVRRQHRTNGEAVLMQLWFLPCRPDAAFTKAMNSTSRLFGELLLVYSSIIHVLSTCTCTPQDTRLRSNPNDRSKTHLRSVQVYMCASIKNHAKSTASLLAAQIGESVRTERLQAFSGRMSGRATLSQAHALTKPPRILGLRTDQQLTAGLTRGNPHMTRIAYAANLQDLVAVQNGCVELGSAFRCFVNVITEL